MADLQGYKKADLVGVCKKLDIPTLAKDTKKVLIDKLDAYVTEHPEDGVLTIQSVLEDAEDTAEEETLAEEETDKEKDEEDKDYEAGAPVDLKEWIVDPVIEKGELLISKFYDFTDKVGITTLDYNDELRENLSKSVTLNYLQVITEAVVFLYAYVPLVPVKKNSTIHQVLKDNLNYVAESDFPLPDLTVFLQFKVLSTLSTWAFTSVLIPLLVSYYVNFSRRVIVYEEDVGIVSRIYSFDPFVFALTKLLVFFFLATNAGSLTSLNSYYGILNAIKNQILIQFGIYREFVAVLGNIPLAVGFANVLVAIYSQFEEY